MKMRVLGPRREAELLSRFGPVRSEVVPQPFATESFAGCRPRIAPTISGRGMLARCMLRPSKQEAAKERLNLADDLRQLAEGAGHGLGTEGLETQRRGGFKKAKLQPPLATPAGTQTSSGPILFR
jgi:hypothetical protein